MEDGQPVSSKMKAEMTSAGHHDSKFKTYKQKIRQRSVKSS